MKALPSLHISSSKPRPYLVRSQDHIFFHHLWFFHGTSSVYPWTESVPLTETRSDKDTRAGVQHTVAVSSCRGRGQPARGFDLLRGERASLSPGQLTIQWWDQLFITPRVLSADGRRAAEQWSGGDGEQEPSRSTALPRKSLVGCGERGPRWAADRGAATRRPQGAVRVQAAMAEDRFPSRPSCEGFTSVSGSFQGPKSHQTWNDWTPANWDCQEDIFSKFPCQIAGKGGYDMPRRIHIYICIHRYKFQIQKSWTLSFWKGCGLHTRTSPTHYPAKAMKWSLHSYLITILQSVCLRTVNDCSIPGIPLIQKCE